VGPADRELDNLNLSAKQKNVQQYDVSWAAGDHSAGPTIFAELETVPSK
jgi:hypothetical protein